jgi:hypothetical protein
MHRGHVFCVTTIPRPKVEPCHDKERFGSFADADRQAWFSMARRRHADNDFMLAAYFCPRCSAWHIGNPRETGSTRWSNSLA